VRLITTKDKDGVPNISAVDSSGSALTSFGPLASTTHLGNVRIATDREVKDDVGELDSGHGVVTANHLRWGRPSGVATLDSSGRLTRSQVPLYLQRGRGSIELSDSDEMGFSVDSTRSSILVTDGESYSVNSIHAVSNTHGHIDITKHTTGAVVYSGIRLSRVSIDGYKVTQELQVAVNQLNDLFTQATSGSGSAPKITSQIEITMTEGTP